MPESFLCVEEISDSISNSGFDPDPQANKIQNFQLSPPPCTMRFKLLLDIHEIEGLSGDMFRDCSKSNIVVGIEWAGSGRKLSWLPGGLKKDHTSKQAPQANGIISWNQQFSRTCKLHRITTQSYTSRAINIQIQEVDGDTKGKVQTIGKTGIDIAEHAPDAIKRTLTMRIPVKCKIRDKNVDAVLKTSMRLIELRSKGIASLLPRALSLRSLSCMGLARNFGNETVNPSGHGTVYPSAADSWTSEDVSEVTYRELSVSNVLLCEDSHYGQLEGRIEGYNGYKEPYLHEEESYHVKKSLEQLKEQPSLVRLLTNKTKLSFKATNHPKGQPLLNKDSNDIGGDDIDSERLHQSGSHFAARPDETNESNGQCQSQSRSDDESRALGFEDEGHFEVGIWKRKRLLSRDGDMELVTDAFLASLDQHSEKAAGGSACTVLSVVIADWLHRNPQSLPLRCQFDELVHEGCSEWRKLCADENHKERFSDQHFDLDTVLKARVRPLTEDKDMSYVGFFSIEGVHFLQDAMTFDDMWEELLSSAAAAAHGERVYIASWNDHFFVLKMERGAIYLIDTFGERLYEGCKQAYILRFDDESVIYNKRIRAIDDTVTGSGDGEEVTACRGIVSCKEYIKGFLAALPLRELQYDAERGNLEESNLRRLQIELHCTRISC